MKTTSFQCAAILLTSACSETGADRRQAAAQTGSLDLTGSSLSTAVAAPSAQATHVPAAPAPSTDYRRAQALRSSEAVEAALRERGWAVVGTNDLVYRNQRGRITTARKGAAVARVRLLSGYFAELLDVPEMAGYVVYHLGDLSWLAVRVDGDASATATLALQLTGLPPQDWAEGKGRQHFPIP